MSVARQSLPTYSHRYSPKKFSQHQLFACLVLKNFLKTDYRGIAQYLKDSPDLAKTIELKRIPHFTTLQKASRRLLTSKNAQRLLDATVKQHLGRKKRVPAAAIDSTGLQCGCASAYFAKRRKYGKTKQKKVIYHQYPKLGVVSDTGDHFIFAFCTGRGPRPDVDEFKPLVNQAQTRVRMGTLTADAGYDSEPNHRYARQEHRIRTIIPPKHGRPTDKPATGRYRRLMQTRFDTVKYGARSQVETVMSMIKRRQGSYIKGKKYHSQCRDLRLIALTHNIMILLCIEVFYRAGASPFIRPFYLSGMAYAAAGCDWREANSRSAVNTAFCRSPAVCRTLPSRSKIADLPAN